MNNIIVDDGKYLNPKRFTGLLDTPDNFIGKAGQIVVVKDTENGLEYVDIDTLTKSELNQLNDVDIPNPSTGDFLKFDGTNWISSDDNGEFEIKDVIIVQGGGTDKINYALTNRVNKSSTLIIVCAGIYNETNIYIPSEGESIIIHNNYGVEIRHKYQFIQINENVSTPNRIIIKGDGIITPINQDYYFIESTTYNPPTRVIDEIYISLIKANSYLIRGTIAKDYTININEINFNGYTFDGVEFGNNNTTITRELRGTNFNSEIGNISIYNNNNNTTMVGLFGLKNITKNINILIKNINTDVRLSHFNEDIRIAFFSNIKVLNTNGHKIYVNLVNTAFESSIGLGDYGSIIKEKGNFTVSGEIRYLKSYIPINFEGNIIFSDSGDVYTNQGSVFNFINCTVRTSNYMTIYGNVNLYNAYFNTTNNGVRIFKPHSTLPSTITIINDYYIDYNGTFYPNNLYFTGSLLTVVNLIKNKLNDVEDVKITSAISGQLLKFNGTNWVNADTSIPVLELDELSNLNISTPSLGQILSFNGTEWVNKDLPESAASIDELTDTTITTPTDGQVLTFDTATSKWVNKDVGSSEIEIQNTIILQGGGTNKLHTALTNRTDKQNILIIIYPGVYEESLSYTCTAGENIMIHMYSGVDLVSYNNFIRNPNNNKIIISGKGKLTISGSASSGTGFINGTNTISNNNIYIELDEANRSIIAGVYTKTLVININYVNNNSTYLIGNVISDTLQLNINNLVFSNYALIAANKIVKSLILNIDNLIGNTNLYYVDQTGAYMPNPDELIININGDVNNAYTLKNIGIVNGNNLFALGGKSSLTAYKGSTTTKHKINITGELRGMILTNLCELTLTGDIYINNDISNTNKFEVKNGNILNLTNCNLKINTSNIKTTNKNIFDVEYGSVININNFNCFADGVLTGFSLFCNVYLPPIPPFKYPRINLYNNNYTNLEVIDSGGSGIYIDNNIQPIDNTGSSATDGDEPDLPWG